MDAGIAGEKVKNVGIGTQHLEVQGCKGRKVSCHSITREQPPLMGQSLVALSPVCEKALQHIFGR
jgi:hypothetical protein